MKRYRKEGRNDPKYALWHMQVLERDRGRCLSCGNNANIYVYNFSSKQTYNIDDGICLCTDCKRHIWYGDDIEWICRCLIVERKLQNEENKNFHGNS